MEVSLTVTPHPVTLDGQRIGRVPLIAGRSLLSLLNEHAPEVEPQSWVVAVGGFEVAPEMWAHTRPAAGAVIECRCVARKKFFALAATIALAYYAPVLGAKLFPAAAGSIAGTVTLGARVFAAGLQIVGTALINKILAPKQAGGLRDNSASPTYALSGGRNRARLYEPIPLVFGELRYTPDYASLPYTIFEGEDQYLYSVFHAGINCGSVSSLRIGKTAIENYAGVSTRSDGISEMTQEPLEGWGNVDTIAGGELVGAGPYVTRTSSVGTIVLQVDIEGSLYAISASKGTVQSYGTNLYLDYRLVGAGTWTPWFGSTDRLPVINASTKPVRRTLTLSVPEGQYEVRIKKGEADESTTTRVNSFTWTSLKSVQVDTGTYGGMGRYGLKIKASGQINGALDELNWIATAKPMPYWNGSAWVTATSRATGLSNPGAQMLLYMRGIYDDDGKLIAGMGLEDSQIDIEAMQGFMVWCDEKGFTFDAVFDAPINHADLLDTIAAVGFGTHSWSGGKLGVSWAADDQPIEGVVNMATMRARSFRVSYQTVETADGLEYAYYDRDRDYVWKTIRVSDPNSATVLNPSRINSVGVTSEAHAAILARFHMAQSLYQRKDIGFDTDLEHLTYRRNSVMMLTHDVTQWGYGGRLRAAVDVAGVVTLTLDDYVPPSAVQHIGLRIPGERGYRVFSVEPFGVSSNSVTLVDAWPSGVAFPGEAGNPAQDTIWIYDFKATPGQKVRVLAINPQPGLSGASVAVVPESDEFWSYVWNGDYEEPASNSLLPFGTPAVTGLRATEELQRQGTGYQVELTLVWNASGAYSTAQVWAARTGTELQLIGSTRETRFSWVVGPNDTLDIEVRPFTALGAPGTVAATTYAVLGLLAPPDAPANVAATPDMLLFSAPQAIDIAGFVARYNTGTNSEWSVGTPLHAVTANYSGGLIPGSPWPMPVRLYGVNTVMVKSVDTSGNESVVAFDTQDFGAPDAANVADTEDYAATGFPGTITNGTVSGTDLEADVDSTTDFYGLGRGADIYYLDGAADIYGGAQYLTLTYEDTYTPPYTGGVVLIDTTITGARATISYRLDPADAWKPWPGAYGPTTASAPIYFQIVVDGGSTQGVIEDFSARLEMPTLEQTFGNVAVSSSGTTLAPSAGLPARTWIAIEDVQITPIEDASGAVSGRVISISPSGGPVVELLNSSATAVTGTAFVRVSGY